MRQPGGEVEAMPGLGEVDAAYLMRLGKWDANGVAV